MKLEFNSDGSIKVPERFKPKTPEEHVKGLINELRFPVGKKLLCEILRGEESDRIKKLRLHHLREYGSLPCYDEKDMMRLLDDMICSGLIMVSRSRNTNFLPVLEICQNQQVRKECSRITDDDRKIFSQFGGFLDMYNDEQKKAIIDPNKRIVCIAGAGTGKTTVLTKRIEFLAKYRSIPTESMLAITFTKKARDEMKHRLDKLIPGHYARIETFNSFCEKNLRKYHGEVYSKDYKVMDFGMKLKIMQKAISKKAYSTEQALQLYFSGKKIRENEPRMLFMSLANDIFSLHEHYRNNMKDISDIRSKITMLGYDSFRRKAEFVYEVMMELEKIKQDLGLRDFTDQLEHTIRLFEQKKELIPRFSHVLVDEFQDVNDLQVKLLMLLDQDNLFVVGDPRQSIYGWRGSKVAHISCFDGNVIELITNYRSTGSIVNTANVLIKQMNLSKLVPEKTEDGPILLVSHPNEEQEAFFIAQSILSQGTARNEIFILARTNRQLDFISQALGRHGIPFLKKTEELNQETMAKEEEVTLSTVHAIKGLEAELVYLAGANSNMYPCMVSDHPVIDALKVTDDYDKYGEELRLLYVAMTRAKKSLVINYYGSLSPFITDEIKRMMKEVDLA